MTETVNISVERYDELRLIEKAFNEESIVYKYYVGVYSSEKTFSTIKENEVLKEMNNLNKNFEKQNNVLKNENYILQTQLSSFQRQVYDLKQPKISFWDKLIK